MTHKNKKSLIWEKWRDPYGSDLEEAEWPGAFEDPDTDIEEGTFLDESFDYDNEVDHFKNANAKIQHVISTPMGIVPITEHTDASKLFNFWTAHTNFRITESIARIIDEEIDGIESLNIFTPYRMRISIGKAFDSKLVKQNIQEKLGVTN